MSKNKGIGPGDEAAKATRQFGDGFVKDLPKPIRERIEEVVGKVYLNSGYCYDEEPCTGGHDYIDGQYEAVEMLEALFKEYLQDELKKRGLE